MKLTPIIRRAAERVLIWAICRELRHDVLRNRLDPAKVRKIATEFISNTMSDAYQGALWNKGEVEITKQRLGRRYDLGMALNESAQRAIEAKKAAPQLTSAQQAALKFQEGYLQKIVERS